MRSRRIWVGTGVAVLTVALLAGPGVVRSGHVADPAGDGGASPLDLPAQLASTVAATTATVPATVDRTGARDVTVALNGFFAGVPDGSTISFPAGARYRIEGTLYLKNRNNLVIDGNGSTFFATTDGAQATPYPAYNAGMYWPRNRDQWLFDTSTNIIVRDMIVKGANPKAGPTNAAFVVDLEAQHGIEFARTSGTIENVSVTDTYGDLVSITKASNGVTVRNSRFERSGRQGITVDQAVNVTIDRNYVGMIGRSAFDLEPAAAGWVVRNVRISNNVVGQANGVAVAAYGQGLVDDVTLVGNTLVDEDLVVLVTAGNGGRRKNWKVLDNTSDSTFGSPNAPLRFVGVDGVEVRGNLQQIASTQSRLAVRTVESCDVVVAGNDFPLWGPSSEQATLTTDGYECGDDAPPTTKPPTTRPPTTPTTRPPVTTTPTTKPATTTTTRPRAH